MTTTIYTIGHSNRAIGDFLDLPRANAVRLLADIRTVPTSRHNPQFGQDALRRSLAETGIDYQHLPGLGGRRRTGPDSINTAWRNTSFRG